VVVNFKANDGLADSATKTLTITVTGTNDAPVLTGIQTTLAGGTEDTAYTVSAANLLAGFTDVDGDMLSVSGLSANHGTIVDNGNGTFTITPTANYNGSVGLGYNVIDGHGGSVAASETFSLAAVNDAPFDIDLRASIPIVSDTNAKGTTVGTLVAFDPDSTVFSFSIVSDTTASFAISGNSLNLASDKSLNTLSGNAVQAYDVTVRATDNGTPNMSYDETIRLSVGTNGSADTLNGQSPDPLNLSSGDDVIYGFNKNDAIVGQGGDDSLFGMDGDDSINGGSGADLIVGGAGNDALIGGTGNDTFVFNTAQNQAGVDAIADFVSGTDHIVLSKADAFASLVGSAGATTLGADFNTVGQSGGHIVYDSASGNLYYDANGGGHTLSGGGADSVLFATLTGHPTLVATDFVIG